MTTTRGRREEYSTNVVRVLHPTRPLSPGTNVADIDNNLDYLLEDLQSSVSRPDSSVGHSNITNYTTNSRDMQYLSPVNSTTVVRERSVSPGSDTRKVYQTASYQYSTSGGRSGVEPQQNVNQLDTLLQDLQHERDITRDKEYIITSSTGVDPGYIEPGTSVTKVTRIYKTNTLDGKPSVQRELLFDSPDSSTIENIRIREKSPSYHKTIETKTTRDVAFEPSVPDREQIVATNTVRRQYNNYGSPEPYSKTVTTVDTVDLPDDLKSVPLADDILPIPGTKVTTTVRTYTYEIPSEPTTTTNKTLLYKNESYNTLNKTTYPEREVPQSVLFQTTSYDRNNAPQEYPPAREPSLSPGQNNTTTIIHKRDTTETTRNYPPAHTEYVPVQPVGPVQGHPPGNTTIIYKHDIRNTTNTSVPAQPPQENWVPGYPPSHPPHHPPQHPPQPQQQQPPQHLVQHPGQPGHPNSGPTTTYYYKQETSNTTNTLYGPPGSAQPNGKHPAPYPNDNIPNQQPQNPIITYPTDNYPNRPPHQQPKHPNDPTTIHYNYTTHTTTTNTHGSPSEREPLLHPAPFPTDGLEPNDNRGQPPQRLDDLLATLDHVPNGPGRDVVDEPYMPRREVETAVATPGKPIAHVEPKIPSKNIAGPPVYYPPGQELFARKEESSAAAYRAQGGYSRASGRYEYESESRSKTKTKSGAAVVPLCLPLCCACTIM